jgi:hypothetical protein
MPLIGSVYLREEDRTGQDRTEAKQQQEGDMLVHSAGSCTKWYRYTKQHSINAPTYLTALDRMLSTMLCMDTTSPLTKKDMKSEGRATAPFNSKRNLV